MPHSSQKRALRELARGTGGSYAGLLAELGTHNSVRVHKADRWDLPRFFNERARPDMPRICLLSELLRSQTAGLGRLFVASTANTCLGHLYVTLRLDRSQSALRSPQLAYYWVRENRRKAGIAKRLVATAEQWLHKHHHDEIHALVDPSDGRAVSLFESLDYEYLLNAQSYRDEFRPDGRRIRTPMTLAVYAKLLQMPGSYPIRT